MADRKISVTLDIGANISQIRSAAVEAQKILNNIGADPKNSAHLKNMFSDLEEELNKLEQKSSKALTGLGDTRSISSGIDKVSTIIKNITREIEKAGLAGESGWAKMTEGLAGKMEAASKATKNYNTELKQTEKTYKELAAAITKAEKAQTGLTTSRKKAEERFNESTKVWSASNLAKGRASQALNRAQDAAKKWADDHEVRLNKDYAINANDAKKLNTEDLEQYKILLDQVIEKQKEFNQAISAQNTAKTNFDKDKQALSELKSAEQEAQIQVENTKKALENFNRTAKDTASFENLKNELTKTFGDESFRNVKNIDELNDKLKQLAASASNEVKTGLLQIFETMNKTSSEVPKMVHKTDEVSDSIRRMGETSREIEHLASRLKYFFSLAGGFQLMRRAVRSATETTKELDAVMTQTAVVSKFTVGDMWKTLPEYSKYAKQLGTAIKDVYSAQTLYVQQGLSMDKAMDIGIETLKMARVANIDAAEATNSMTAALRGFNMELNETSAQRINDVYSKLAQNTASNTQEISTAMTKTAALANSANMSFENTAAFLATIIESTREGAETAGTALKTVIARFTEVKKLYSEGELLGTDEEGQEVDVNKISAALRTAGINMNDFFTGAKGLDEIFLELGSKWDSLTTVQQRYIATMAAGSRQQSRFLALMQNYNRTVELTQMAYNSAGSGQEQFEKTLDSLQAKIEKFKAEWQTFIMGIANSDAIKGIIDVGTKILEIINKIIDSISGGNGLVKGIASIATAVGVFKGGRSLIKMIMGGAGNYGLGGIIGNWLGVKNGYGEKQEQATAFKASMRERGRRTEYLHTSWFGKGGVLNPKGRVANNELIPQAEADAKKYAEAYNAALEKQKIAAQDYKDSRGTEQEAQARVNLTNANEDVRQTQTKYEESQKSLDNIKSSATDAGTAMYQYGQAAKTAGMAAGVAAGACMLLATALDKTGNTKAAKTLRGIGTVLTVLSGVFMVLGQVAQITGAQIAAGAKTASTAIMNIPIIGWIAAIISALIALGVAISNFVETDAEKAQRLAAETENARQVAEQTSQAYDDLLSAKSGYDELVNQLEGLTKGTIEYKNALYEANQQVLELAKNHPKLEYKLNRETGLLEIDENSWNEVQQGELNRKQMANAIYNLASVREEKTKIDEELENTRKTYGTYNLDYKEHDQHLFYGQRLTKGLTDEEIRALIQLGYTDYDLTKILEEQITNHQGKTYKQLAVADNVSYSDVNEIWSNFTKYLQNKTKDIVPTLTDPYEKVTQEFQNSLYSLSDQEKKSSYTLSKLYNTDSFNIAGAKASGEDYKRKDISGQWTQIIDAALKRGNITETQAASLKSGGYTKDKNRLLYSYVNNESLEAVNKLDKQAIWNWTGDYFKGINQFEQFEIDQKEFEALDPKVQDAFIELSEAPNNLTLEQIETLKTAWSDIGKIGFDTEILKEYQDTLDDLYSNLNFKTDNIEFGKYLSKNLQNQRKELDQWFNSEFLGQYDNLLNSIVTSENFTDTQKGSIVNLLSNTNIKSLDDLYKVIDNLKEAGIDLEAQDNNVYNSLISFAKALGDAGIATKKWSQENAKEAIKNARGIANNKEESQDRKFTKEEFAIISELFRGTEYDDELKYFMEQTDGSYKYVGPYLDTIINALYIIANKIPGEQIGSVGGKVDLANIIKTKKETTESKVYDDYRKKLWNKVIQAEDKIDELWNSGAEINEAEKEYNDALIEYNRFAEDVKQFGTFIPSEEKINDLYKTDSDKADFYNDTIKNLQNLYGVEDKDLLKAGLLKEVDASTVGAVWQTLLDILFNPEALEAEAETLRQQIEVNSLIGASPAQLANASLGQSITGYDENGKPIINKEAYTKQNQGLADSALETAIEEENLTDAVARDTEWLDKNTTALKGNAEEQNAVKQAVKVNADTAKKAEKNFDNLTQTIKDNNEALKSKDSLTRQRALDSIAKSARKAFGDNKKITAKFVNDNEKAFTDFANGVEGAEDTIREALTKDLVSDLNLTEAKANQLSNILQTMSDTPVSVDGTADFTSIVQALADVMGSAEEAAALLQSLGYSITWVEDGVVHDSLTGLDMATNYKVLVSDSAGTAVNRNKGGGGGGGGGGKKEFKNDFDKYYNMVEDINELERLRNLLETDYEQLLKSEAISGKAIYDNLKKQIQLLKERRDITADLAEKRKGQIFETMNDKQYASVRKYAWWNDTDQTIEIDWDAINKVKDSKQGDLIKEYVSKLEGFQSQYDEQIEALEDIETTLQEIQKRGQEEYTSLEDRTRDALIKQIQDKIDELTAVDEAINDTNQKLMDSIQKELEKQRQERENAKTEEELADKEQRLAYLQQDSSGANALEIAKLQEELADARESYTDSLIDQKITELQEQNDEAAQQRQEQIDLMQQSLDWQEKSGAFWEQVYEYIQAGTDEVGTLVHGSELENLLKAGEAWDSLSEEGQMKWLEELENQVAQAIGYLSLSRQLEEIGTKEGTKITFTDAEGNTHTGTVDKNGNVVVKNADGSTTTWKDVYQSYDGSYQTLETQENAQTTPKPATNSGKPSSNGSNGSTSGNNPGGTPPPQNQKKYGIAKLNDYWVYPFEYSNGTYTKQKASEIANQRNNETAAKLQEKYDEAKARYSQLMLELKRIQSEDSPILWEDEQRKRQEMQQAIADKQKYAALLASREYADKRFKTGGLADYTGPAWLDGTPSKPELVLNARDTENFIQLKDHLAALRQAGTLNTGGDNYYDIDVHVDSLGSDYDVDMAIDRIKTRLYQDGAYRNVNTLNRLR